MATKRMDFGSFVGKLLAEEDTDVLREGVRVLAQALMDAEVSTQIGAELYERTDSRVARRNGYCTRIWDTRVGTTFQVSVTGESTQVHISTTNQPITAHAGAVLIP